MSTLVQPYSEHVLSASESDALPRFSETAIAPHSSLSSFYCEQVQSLVQQLFFTEDASARHIGITAADESTEVAHLCLDIAQVLASQGRFDVGLIDACPLLPPLEAQLELTRPEAPDAAWAIERHLWFVPRQSCMDTSGTWTEQSTARLRELAAEFDFSILQCPPVSWLTGRIGRACDGLVLVLTAHKTRRLVARQIRDHIQKTKIPLLGTVLRERRLPIPEALYRAL